MSAEDRASPAARPAVAAVGLLLVIVGGSMFNILPLLTAGAADKLGFSTQQAGIMSSALTVASGLSAVVAGFWVRSLSWSRTAAAALAGMGSCLLIALGGTVIGRSLPCRAVPPSSPAPRSRSA